MTCARISLATCAILLACAARRVKRIACAWYSSCASRFIVCRVACCALSCWLCCAVLSYGDALRWLCGAACCAWSGGYLSLLLASSAPWCCVVAVVLPWCCPVCWPTVCAASSARHALLLSLTVLLRSLAAACHPVGFHPLPFRARLFRLRRARSAYLAILITIVTFIII